MTGQQKVVVIAVIRNPEGKYLIAKRNDQDIPDSHNKWELVGGKLEYGEDPKDALLREVKEEAGLLITDITLAPKIFTQVWKRKMDEGNVTNATPFIQTAKQQIERIKENLSAAISQDFEKIYRELYETAKLSSGVEYLDYEQQLAVERRGRNKMDQG
jgi:mutator protein MutT